jgi:hypothetical protein
MVEYHKSAAPTPTTSVRCGLALKRKQPDIGIPAGQQQRRYAL